MALREKRPALLLIDFQQGMDEEDHWGGNRNNRDAEKKAALLLEKWRALNLAVYHIQHSSQNPHSPLHRSHPGYAIKEEVQPLPGEPVIVKRVNSGFIGTDLQERLDENQLKTLVVAGLTTNHCVSTTVRMAANLGYETILVSDATATFDREGIFGEPYDSEQMHLISLASLKDEFARVMTSDQLLEQL